jgi:protoporphyrinogen/coproporphyrinogen III oxidase
MERAEVAIVGGGIAGLAAAWHLRDRDVVVLEAADRVGGRIRSDPRDDVWLNFGAHVFAGAGSATDRLLHETGVASAPVTGRLAAVAVGGQIAASGRVETYPFRLPLSPRSRLALIRAGVRLRLAVARYGRVAEPRPGEAAADRQRRLLDFMDDRSFSDFIGPLPPDVDAIFRATLNRSSGEPEELAAGYGVGYFHLVWNRSEGLSRTILGGPGRLVDAIGAGLGPRVRTGTEVVEVVPHDEEVVIRHTGGELRARAAIVATPAYAARQLVRDLPEDTAEALAAVRYGPYVVGAFLTREPGPMPWDRIYALATPGRSFGMLFNVVNALRTPGAHRANGSLMVYAAAGAARALADLDDASVARRFTADLEALYPEARGIVDELVVQRWERGLPFAAVGRSRLQAALARPLGRIHLAGDYLGTWYTETACSTGEAAARSARSTLPPA